MDDCRLMLKWWTKLSKISRRTTKEILLFTYAKPVLEHKLFKLLNVKDCTNAGCFMLIFKYTARDILKLRKKYFLSNKI